MTKLKLATRWLAGLLVVVGVGLAAFVYSGVYDVAATSQHTLPVYGLLEAVTRRSVVTHARAIEVPPLTSPALAERGFRLYDQHCVQCHGAPGVAPAPFALGLLPAPANLPATAREWTPAEVFWTVKHGLKMTGMPAWKFRLPEEDIWAIVAFVRQLPTIAPLEYQALRRLAAPLAPPTPESIATEVDSERGRQALLQYMCLTCHEIPGVIGVQAHVGPPLDRIGTRAFIAGVIPNTPENMIRWLRNPHAIDPRTAMPDLYVTERDARDIAAYLHTLR
ncbi:MAG: c-type cytochrome [Burkholderiaceae bacterium]